MMLADFCSTIDNFWEVAVTILGLVVLAFIFLFIWSAQTQDKIDEHRTAHEHWMALETNGFSVRRQ